MNWRDYIVSNPEILVGKPEVKVMPLPLDLILDRPADSGPVCERHFALVEEAGLRKRLLPEQKAARG